MSEQPAEKRDYEPKRLARKQVTGAPRRKREIAVMVLLIITALITASVATIRVLYVRWVQRPDLPTINMDSNPEESGSVSNPGPGSIIDDPQPDASQRFEALEPKVSGERRSQYIYTILVVGTDIVSNSTDTMMLLTYDVSNQRATVMSIPRDTLVNVKSGSVYTRLNSVYTLYGRGERGMAALTREVSELVGFVPDFRVFIEWELVGEMVDAIGGVEFDVPYRMKYDDDLQDLHIDLMPGLQTLDGEHAMQLVRWRKNNPGVPGSGTGSDIQRLEIQHNFLKAVLTQTFQPQNVFRIPELIELFSKGVVSDLAVENMLWFGQQAALGGLKVDDVEFITMPYYYFGSYVCPREQGLLTVINEKLNPYTTEVTIRELDLIQGNSDGSLSSSTGVLADPRAAQPQKLSDSEDE